MAIKVTSPAFKPSGLIPSQYTCDGADFSPPLAWSGAPSNTKSIAMIVDDPDAPDPAKPQRVYVHWVVYNLPPNTAALPRTRRRKVCQRERCRARTTGVKPSMVGHVRQSDGIATSSSFTHSTRS